MPVSENMPNDEAITLSSWPNAILHTDADAFFASCEQAIHPELKGKPVVTGKERNIVASMSYEAKALGIVRATAIWEAKKICPNVIILPSDYETYSLFSKRMFAILRRFTPTVEESSIDEGYADLKGLRRLYRSGYDEITRKIQETIQKELGLSISVGLGLTKTLAKLAAKHKKPHGFMAVPGWQIHLFLKDIPVGKVCGIGQNTAALLNKNGVFTAWDYVKCPEVWIKKLWGKIGIELWHELRGEMVYQLSTEEKTTYDSISKTKTFTPPSDDLVYVRAQLFRNAESAFIKLRRYRLRAQRLAVYLREQNFRGSALEADLNRPATCPLEAFPLIEKMLNGLFKLGTFYRSTGIILSRIKADNGLQFELFEDPLRMINMHRLGDAIDEINGAFGRHAIHTGTGLFLGRNQRKNRLEKNERNVLPERKSELLPGETFRQRVNIPMWRVNV